MMGHRRNINTYNITNLHNVVFSESLAVEMENGTEALNLLVTLDIGGRYGTDSYKSKSVEALL